MDNKIIEDNILAIYNNKESPIIKPINNERLSKWIDDGSVTNCFNCKKIFSFLFRKHHCRLCGRVFCYYCSNYFTRIPDSIIDTIYDTIISKSEVRVCEGCFAYIKKISKIQKIIKVFMVCNFNIIDLMFLSKIYPEWNDAILFLLNKFKDIQYKLCIESLTHTEKNILWINKKYLSGHMHWISLFVKAFPHTKYIEHILNNNIIDCKYTKCNKICANTDIVDILNLIKYNTNNMHISKIIRQYIVIMDNSKLIYYLPFIVYYIKNNTFILDLLIKKGIDNYVFMSKLYWCIKVYCIDINKNTYLETILHNTTNFNDMFLSMISLERINTHALYKLNEHKIYLPICQDKIFTQVDTKFTIMSSSSQPIILSFVENNKHKKIMFKNDDIRKDHIIINILNIIYDILKSENMHIDNINYEVIPTSKNTGYIEIVENADTIYNIVNSGYTIQNYILNHNKNQIIGVFRDKIIKSTALYCVVSYLLGIGDRHLDNIMISKDGLLFHIDFGFILGQDPKYSTNKMLRVTPEIINVIGGYGSNDYNYFKETCIKIYNHLRTHVHLFSNLLSVIPMIDPTITNDILKKELMERFEIGENSLEAATHMDVKVESKYNFEYMVIDFLYNSKQTTVYKGLSYMSSTLYNVFRT